MNLTKKKKKEFCFPIPFLYLHGKLSPLFVLYGLSPYVASNYWVNDGCCILMIHNSFRKKKKLCKQ